MESNFGKAGKFGRDRLNDEDIQILEEIKKSLTESIEKLKGNGLRYANIQIALESHIKKHLKDD